MSISEDWRVVERKTETNLEQMEEDSSRRNEGWNFASRLGTTYHAAELNATDLGTQLAPWSMAPKSMPRRRHV
jgi:hypothetical protein